MGGRIVREGCACSARPPADRHGPGTVWQCDCGKYWGITAAGIAPGMKQRWVELGVIDRMVLGLPGRRTNPCPDCGIDLAATGDGCTNPGHRA